MTSLSLSRGALLLALASLGFGGAALAAKPPAYTFSKLAFSTTLRGIPEGERHDDCLNKECSERGGVVVAEGKTTTLPAPVTITIREFRTKNAGASDLVALGKKQQTGSVHGKIVRTVSGQVAERPALEQWSIWDGCQRVVSGRVFVAMADKVIEIETRSVLEPGHDPAATSVGAMTQVLQKLRVRRLGDAVLDPASEAIAVKDLAAALPRSCEK